VPTYDYRCANCGHQFEHFQSMSSNKLRKCPECAQPKLERLIGGGAGVIFKGGGFYETDYKAKKSPGKSGGGEGKTEKSDTAKTETNKPAEKSTDSKPSGGDSSSKKSGD
jgi:putative FmdB family regulatory protein